MLYPAIRSVLENEDSVARGSLQPIYGKLSDRDLVALLPAILKDNNNNAVVLDKAIAAIEAATDSPTLVDLKDFKTRP